MKHNDLNLARKWRPTNFSEIVGQDLSIRMLKNGLYLKKYFPLYIFSGQRGCGKTTTARVFATAINCELLSSFQSDPKSEIPCNKCDSCNAMLNQSHPDFIEMDAASHTGVDNVRQILESASFISIHGGAKVYLIDEAHMLSRAAFNAFLKILEEPPEKVFFILATTELHKIPDTVRSRAFQVFFNTIESTKLSSYLSEMCKLENIDIKDDALKIIIAESGGSARDAINLLERVRLLDGTITKEVVLTTLGKISEETFFQIFNLLIDQKPTKLLETLAEISFENLSAQSLWDMLVSCSRAIIWYKHGLESLPHPFETSLDKIKKVAGCSISRINAIMQLLFSQEDLFLKTSQKHLFLESVLLQICGQVNATDLDKLIEKVNASKPASSPESRPRQGGWQSLVDDVGKLEDNLLTSIFRQATFVKFEGGVVTLKLASGGSFLTDKIKDSMDTIRPIAALAFDGFTDFSFEKAPTPKVVSKAAQPRPKMVSSAPKSFSDKEKWPKANLLAEHFSGRIELVK